MDRGIVRRLVLASDDWDVGSGLDELEQQPDLQRAEGLVHELAHGAVFGLPADQDLPERIAEVYEGRNGYYEFRPYLSDLSECRALAVEKLVLERMGWRRQVLWSWVLGSGFRNMRSMETQKEVRRQVNAFLGMRITQRRASQVMGWLKEMLMSGTFKHKLGSEVEVEGKKFAGKKLTIYQVSCGEGRKEPHYWAREGEDKTVDYEFDESEVKTSR